MRHSFVDGAVLVLRVRAMQNSQLHQARRAIALMRNRPGCGLIAAMTVLVTSVARFSSMAFAAVTVAALGLGCDDKSAAAARDCKTGVQEACERACGLGVGDEGGCMAAGLGWIRKRHQLPGAKYARYGRGNPEEDRHIDTAERFYRSACELDVADGCVFAVKLDDKRFEYTLDLSEDPSWVPMNPLLDAAALTRRQTALRRACELGSGEGCRRLGASFVGVDELAADKAFERSCELTGAPGDACLALERGVVPKAAVLARGCGKPKADDCNALGDLVFTVDPARAPLFWTKAHGIRGEAESDQLSYHVVGRSQFVLSRAERGYNTSPEWPAPPPPLPAPELLNEAAGKIEVHLSVTKVISGKYPEEAVRRAMERVRPAALRCCAAGVVRYANLQGAFLIYFKIDPTGDPFRVGTGGNVPDGDAVSCVARVVDDIVLPAPKHGPVLLSQRFILSPKTDPP
jgi:hypothetical protein